jgi:hypothetical protein
MLGLVVGGIRGAVIADPSVLLGVLSFLVSIVSGLAAGKAHHAVSDHRKQKAECDEKLRNARQPVANAEEQVALLEQKLMAAMERRRLLAGVIDASAAEPANHAAEGEDVRKIQAARLAAANYVYELGATFRGRGPGRGGKGHD